MTAQAHDKMIYKLRKYSITALTCPIPFHPRDYGLDPHWRCTACYRGYWCDYKVIHGKLVLENLYINNDEDIYPDFCGTKVSPVSYDRCWCAYDDKIVREKTPKYMGHRLYSHVRLQIPYDGKILIGKDFMSEYYIHMGFQRPIAYKKLLELSFENGILCNVSDCSAIAEEARRRESEDKQLRKFGMAHTDEFIYDSFSQDYGIKAWWLR